MKTIAIAILTACLASCASTATTSPDGVAVALLVVGTLTWATVKYIPSLTKL